MDYFDMQQVEQAIARALAKAREDFDYELHQLKRRVEALEAADRERRRSALEG